MKFTPKILLLSLIIIVACKQASATHYRAGAMTYEVTGDMQIQVTLTTYSKISGQSLFADRDVVSINWGDGTSDSVGRVNGPGDPMTGYPHYGVLVAPDIKQNIYIGNHTYAGIPPIPNSFYIVSFLDNNRMAGINNISDGNSVDVPFYIEDTIWFPNNMIFSSPIFLNPPIDYANVNTTYNFNPVAYDVNGDSIAFELIAPLVGPGIDVPLYQFPGQYCTELGDSSSFRLNQQTGQITWSTPCVTGFFDVAFVIRSFRSGVELGNTEMDMQIIVLQDSDSPPTISRVHDTIIAPGEILKLQFTASDPNPNDTDYLSAVGGAFLLPDDSAVFKSVSGNAASGQLTWQPNGSAMRPSAYIFSIIARDNFVLAGNAAPLANYSTFRVWVADTTATGITQIKINEPFVSLYPNPSSGMGILQVADELIGTKLEILDATGRIVYTSVVNNTSSEIELHVAPGMYVLHIFSPLVNINKKFILL